MAGEKQGLVFISCGQFTPHEIKLGQDLAAAVNELTEFEGYFAQNQTSLEGLSRNIFGALNRCAAFVAVTLVTSIGRTMRLFPIFSGKSKETPIRPYFCLAQPKSAN